MALPMNAPKVRCTLSKPLMADGTAGAITSAFLKMDKDIVWVATGETIFKESVPIVISADPEHAGTLTFEVIPVDVDGVHDAAGNQVKNWSYTLRVENQFSNNVKRSVDYVFQPTEAAGDVDLDLVPQLGVVSVPPVSSPPTAPISNLVDGGLP